MLAHARTEVAPVRVRLVHRECDRHELVASMCLPGVRRSEVLVTRDDGTIRVTGPVGETGLWLVQELDLPTGRRWGDPVVLAEAEDRPVVVRIPLLAGRP
jgi:hypothetical protein